MKRMTEPRKQRSTGAKLQRKRNADADFNCRDERALCEVEWAWSGKGIRGDRKPWNEARGAWSRRLGEDSPPVRVEIKSRRFGLALRRGKVKRRDGT